MAALDDRFLPFQMAPQSRQLKHPRALPDPSQSERGGANLLTLANTVCIGETRLRVESEIFIE